MTGRTSVVAAAAIAGVLAVPGWTSAPRASQAQQTFRASTDVVLVDVSVRDGGRMVTGLGPGDFQLTDNGVRQRVESVETTAVPIDLTIVVDLSGNPRRPAIPPAPSSEVIAGIQSEVERITALLRPEDRVRLFAVDQSVQQLWPLDRVGAQAPIRRVQSDGLASLYDTLTTALLLPVEPARRHIVIAGTKGLDTVSAVGASAVATIARQSDAMLHVVIDETAFDNDSAAGGFQCAFMGFCWPTRRFWVPVRHQLMQGRPTHRLTPEGELLAEAADVTGGALHQTTVSGVPSVASAFRRVFDDFRAGYMLRYAPQGVAREGWHTIEVTVPGSPSFAVRARKGYGVEAPAAVPAPPTVPEVPQTIDELTLAYDREAYSAFVTGLVQVRDPARLIRDFQQRGNPWPAQPRREATLAIELAEAGLFAPQAGTRRAAYDMLGRFARLVRQPLGPDEFEAYWHFAAITIAEGAIRGDETEPIVERALARFPNEPRFVLSRAIVTDQRWAAVRPGSQATDRRGRPTAGHIEAVITRYRAAAAFPAVGAEARTRLALFLSRLERYDEALALLEEAGRQPLEEDSVRYLRALVLGNVLTAVGRTEEAASAYRAAIAAVPAAQSARVALMNTLLIAGDRTGAEALAEQVQSAADGLVDPWWSYWQGQHRFSSGVLARLRQVSR